MAAAAAAATVLFTVSCELCDDVDVSGDVITFGVTIVNDNSGDADVGVVTVDNDLRLR